MTPEERAELRADELRLDAVEELENEHREELHEAGEHQERRDPCCVSCEHEVEDAKAEHAWMARAVRVESESMDLARQDLDMPYAGTDELMHAIQVRLK